MMNDSFAVELRQHLLATGERAPGRRTLAAIVEGVAVTGQRHPLVARLPWSPARTSRSRLVRSGTASSQRRCSSRSSPQHSSPAEASNSRTVFSGTWSSTDPADGSSQTLIIGPGTTPTVHFEDDIATGLACRDDAVKVFTAEGSGQIIDDRLDASFPTAVAAAA